jgi:hypothetical protein
LAGGKVCPPVHRMEGKNLDLERVDAISKEAAVAIDRRGMIRNLTGAALGGILVAARVRGSEAGGTTRRATLYLNPSHTCTGPAPTVITRGYVDYRRVKRKVVVTISLQDALPDAKHDVFRRCVGFPGTITTDGQGAGKCRFTYAFNAGNFQNGVDMFSPGTPATEYIGCEGIVL